MNRRSPTERVNTNMIFSPQWTHRTLRKQRTSSAETNRSILPQLLARRKKNLQGYD